MVLSVLLSSPDFKNRLFHKLSYPPYNFQTASLHTMMHINHTAMAMKGALGLIATASTDGHGGQKILTSRDSEELHISHLFVS